MEPILSNVSSPYGSTNASAGSNRMGRHPANHQHPPMLSIHKPSHRSIRPVHHGATNRAMQASGQQRMDPAESTDSDPSDPTALSIPEKKITDQFLDLPESNKISALTRKPKSKNKRRSYHQSEVVISEESNTNISSASSSGHSGFGSPAVPFQVIAPGIILQDSAAII